MFRARNNRNQAATAIPTSSNDEARKQVSKLSSLRNACAVSVSSVRSKLASGYLPMNIVGLSRQLVELQRWTLQTEVEILDLLQSMDQFDILETLFEIFDKDDSGEVSLEELERALQKVDFHKSVHDSISEALKNFDTGSGQMEFNEFSKFVNDLKEALGWSFGEVTEFLAIHVGFADGAVLLDEGVDMLLGSSSVSLGDDFASAIMEVRLIYLFQMFDPHGKGFVNFEEVVKSLYNLTDDMDQAAREALLMCSSERRALSYDMFSQFMYDVFSAGGYDSDSVANGMTLNNCKKSVTTSDLGQLFHGMVSEEKVAECSETKDSEIDDPVIVGKADRLFDMWDKDHSGQLDLEEIMMGLGKMNETKDVKITLEDTMRAIRSFDGDGDAKLDRAEFRHMLSLFAAKAKIPLHELIDFMVVTSTLKNNDEGFLSYVAAVKARATVQVQRAQSMKKLVRLRNLTPPKLWG